MLGLDRSGSYCGFLEAQVSTVMLTLVSPGHRACHLLSGFTEKQKDPILVQKGFKPTISYTLKYGNSHLITNFRAFLPCWIRRAK